MDAFAAALIAGVVTFVCTPIVRRALIRSSIFDVPNERSSHVGAVPRGGGVAVAMGTVVGAAVMGWSIEAAVVAAAAIALGMVGFMDDRRELSAGFRLAAQFVVPIAATPVLLAADDRSGVMLVALVLIAAGWCATYVNAFNFMDGINGIAVGQTVVAGCALAWMANDASDSTVVVLSLAVAGAAIGFAPFNVGNASVFLGDVGSYFLGAWLALLLVLVVDAGTPLLVALGPFTLYLVDTGTTLVRRFRRGVRLFDGHREHAYQRLLALGSTHSQVAALATAVMAFNSIVLIASSGSALWLQVAAMGVALAGSAAFVALPAVIAARRSSVVV